MTLPDYVDQFMAEGAVPPIIVTIVSANGLVQVNRYSDGPEDREVLFRHSVGEIVAAPLNVFFVDQKGRTAHLVEGIPRVQPELKWLISRKDVNPLAGTSDLGSP